MVHLKMEATWNLGDSEPENSSFSGSVTVVKLWGCTIYDICDMENVGSYMKHIFFEVLEFFGLISFSRKG